MQARDAVNTSHQGKENMPSVVTKDAPAPSPAGIRDHLNCGLCSQLVAAPLVVSCGHMFCGQCLFEHLTKDPMCPTCSMGLRSIPVRCLPVDAVVEALKTHMPAKDRERFNKRVEEGRSAADKVNKIFWWAPCRFGMWLLLRIAVALRRWDADSCRLTALNDCA